jgi:glutamate N-acetyltransferase/amino-acid N-acetyltransferase
MCYIVVLEEIAMSEAKEIPGGTVTTPKGFSAGAVHAGLKSEEKDLPDVGILFSEVPCAAAGVCTTNRVKAAPVLLSQKNLTRQKAQAIVVNAGCANACVGEQGVRDAYDMAAFTAYKLNIDRELVLVASTGVIGAALPMDKVRNGIDGVILSPEGGHDLAWAIMTTDTVPKETAVSVGAEDKEFIIGGIAKGSGMIHPNMATLLCFITTDAAVDADFLQMALRRAVDVSFNMITIDGDTSTNDTVFLLANGLAQNETIGADSPAASVFEKALGHVCLYLAKLIAGDGEGATKLIAVTVEGALTVADARMAARIIASSPLVKSAIYGADPNWGRIMAALGRSGVEIEGAGIDVYLDGLQVAHGTQVARFDPKEAKAILSRRQVTIKVNLHVGKGSATAWGCDLSEEYVTINSAYRT